MTIAFSVSLEVVICVFIAAITAIKCVRAWRDPITQEIADSLERIADREKAAARQVRP